MRNEKISNSCENIRGRPEGVFGAAVNEIHRDYEGDSEGYSRYEKHGLEAVPERVTESDF